MSDSLNILVVEDDDALRDALLITLRHRRTSRHRGRRRRGGTVRSELARDVFSMVVSDLRMDPMDGLTLLREMRSRQVPQACRCCR